MAPKYTTYKGARLKEGTDPSEIANLGFGWKEYDPAAGGAYCTNDEVGMCIMSVSGEIGYIKLNESVVQTLLRLCEKGILTLK